MTPRERAMASIDHRESDRAPMGLGATQGSGISAIRYGQYQKHLGAALGRPRILGTAFFLLRSMTFCQTYPRPTWGAMFKAIAEFNA
jgi:hypothetical protein